ENGFPSPAVTPNSVGAWTPGPNGSLPPRTPIRRGDASDPTSPPSDQEKVSCELGPDPPHNRHATAPATAASVPARHCTPPPKARGSSVVAVVRPPTSAVSFESDRTHPASRRSWVTSSKPLTDAPRPPSATS